MGLEQCRHPERFRKYASISRWGCNVAQTYLHPETKQLMDKCEFGGPYSK